MRALFTVAGLLVVLAVIGVLAKQQLGAGRPPRAVPAEGTVTTAPAATPQQQVRQFEQAVQGAIQQAPRQEPDDAK